MRKRKWSEQDLYNAVKTSVSYRQVIKKLGLKTAGGNYAQLKKYIKEYKIDISHFTGKGWNKGLKFNFVFKIPLNKILKKNSQFQSYKLKNRLYKEGLKKEKCEECGWSKKTASGRLPLELHHINGDFHDNRLDNLIILCPNCHSLKPNYRGLNINKNKP